MNTIASFRKCTLSDDELLKEIDTLTDEMFKYQKVPTRNIPARPDEDYDLLIGELILRFNNNAAKGVKAEQLSLEFRSIISHALLGCNTEDVDKETWDLICDKCAEYAAQSNAGNVWVSVEDEFSCDGTCEREGATLINPEHPIAVTDWKAKVEFYREQTEKLRNYLHDNNIGKPCQGFFDAILEHLQSLKPQPIAVGDVEKAAQDYAEKKAFRVPYDGSNKFYDDKVYKEAKDAFIAVAEWQAKQQPINADELWEEVVNQHLILDNSIEELKKQFNISRK